MKDKIKNNKNSNPTQYESYRFRIKLIRWLITLPFVALVYRLFNLQIINGKYFKERSLNNKKQIVQIPAYRGEVFTGEEELKIIENLPSYSLYLTPQPFYQLKKNPLIFKKTLTLLKKKFNFSEESILNILKKRKTNPLKPRLIKNNASQKEIFYLAENQEKFPGLLFVDTSKRNYLKGESYAHITGYIQSISSKEYQKKKNQGYTINSIIGKQGIEAYYDKELRGKDSFKIQTVDVKNRIKDEFINESNSPTPGRNIYLTIEPRIQDILAKVMEGYIGGAIVSKVSTGEILGLYSYPNYDPNIFSGKIDQEKFKKLLENKDNPFFNRIIQGEYPPSSIFKIIVFLTALENPQVNFNSTRYYCNGGLRIGGKYFKCTGTHKMQNLSTAIINSCNVYFYKLGILIGPNTINRYAKSFFNLGKKFDMDLPFEKPGRIPSRKWKLERIGNFWWDGDTANFSIGQGYTTSTILQINTITAAIANNGLAFKPHLIKKFYDLEKEQEIINNKEVFINLPFSQLNLKRIQNAMRQVVTWGTAKRINNERLPVAGKTGTAETFKTKEPHSWFTGYTPSKKDDEKIAVSVLIENGGFGGVLAAVFSSAIIEATFLKKDPYLLIKEKFQTWETQKNTYKNWLKIKKQEKLPESYFEKA